MDNLKIRQITEKDLDKLAEIYTEVYRVFDVGEKWTTNKAKILFEYWLKTQPDLCYCAELGGKLIGAFVVGIKPWWDGNQLVDGEIFVHPDYHKKGIGTELSKTVFRVALQKYQVVSWVATTFKNKEFPLSWYQRLGFKEDGNWILITGDVKKALEILEENSLNENPV